MSKAIEKSILKDLGKPTTRAAVYARYLGSQGHPQRAKDEQSSLIFWGVRMPRLRQLARGHVDRVLKDKDFQKSVNQLVKVFVASRHFEVRTVVLYVLLDKKILKKISKKSSHLSVLVAEVENWVHSDLLSDAIARYLEEEPQFFHQMKLWNKSKNAWERRQSLVGVYCYVRQRNLKVPAQKVFPLVRALLQDPHYFVQKGLGWTLRELYQVEPKKQIEFVRNNLSRISATAWYAASEQYPLKLKKDLVNQRKQLRKS
jgi:3-methyladenine DNA glycosylase AlkD